PDHLMESLGVAIPSWVPLAMGIAATVGTVLLSTWNPNRFREFLCLIGGTSCPASKVDSQREDRSRFGDDRHRQRMWIFRALETSFSNVAFFLESAIV